MISRAIVILVTLILSIFPVILRANDIQDAIQKGDITAVKALIANNKALIDMKSDNGQTPLHLAVRSGNREIVEYLISQGADIDAKDDAQNTPLITALTAEKAGMAELLLSRGADVKIRNAQGETAILVALMHGLNELAAPILDKGQDVNERFRGNFTALLMATFMGDKNVVKLLLDRGADVNAAAQEGSMIMTPMYAAIFMGHRDVVEQLLSARVDREFREKQTGRTLLHIAVLKGARDIVSLLIDGGYDVTVTDNAGNTPLHYASKYGHQKIAELLLQNGARPKHVIGNFGMSPLLNKKLEDGEATIWYMGNSGWAIRTKSKFLVFDYQLFGAQPDEPWLANGHINPEEIKDQAVYVFVTHDDNDHFTPVIFEWKKSIDAITYIMGFAPENASDVVTLAPRQNRAIDGMEVSTIASTDAGVSFLVKVDGLTIFHAGDNVCRQKDLKGPYADEIDYLNDRTTGVDLAFFPIIGCRFRDPEALKNGIIYALEKLKPEVTFPMHALGFEYQHDEFARDSEEKTKTQFACAQNGGDCFLYIKGEIEKQR